MKNGIVLMAEDEDVVTLRRGSAQVFGNTPSKEGRVQFLEGRRLEILLEQMVQRELAFYEDEQGRVFVVYVSSRGKAFMTEMAAA